MTNGKKSIHVSLVTTPDTMLSTLISIYDVLNCFELFGSFADAVPDKNPFQAEIVAPTQAHTQTASGLPVTAHRTVDQLDQTDIIIVPSMMPEGGEWKTGRYPKVVNWLSEMHAQGAMLCSACSGVLLLAETGLLDGGEATIHWAYARTFRRNFPNVGRLGVLARLGALPGRQACRADGSSGDRQVHAPAVACGRPSTLRCVRDTHRSRGCCCSGCPGMVGRSFHCCHSSR